MKKKKRTSTRRGSSLIHHLQNISHQKKCTFWYCVVNDEVPPTSSQIFEQIEVIQGVVLPGISKLNDSVPVKKPGDQTQSKRRIYLILPIKFAVTSVDESC